MANATASGMSELLTIRDYLRYAVSLFRAAKLVHGHGTTSVVDEAAFIVLETLNLPVDDINPWLDARLLEDEKKKLAQVIRQRIETRKPAAYLLKKTYLQGIPFFVDERVIIPRSYIAELMMNGFTGADGAPLFPDPSNVETVLDLCTGSGCLAILASQVFTNAEITATDISKIALEVAAINVKDHGVEDRVSLVQGDLFAPLAKQKFDLIIANPPYVAEAEVDAFPPEYGAEPVLAHLGGSDGMDLVRKIIKDAPRHLNKGGALVCEIGTGSEIIEDECPNLDLFWLDTEESVSEVFVLRG
jgi:ribosomal protein L3 glutamine methyltransferase